ncbi:putative bifunctional diguanylate cyclase/phosphodiesterase [Asticcacaulis solisilvae]|uniref:putative bifunctional diguanylate cyclase/phosphodiesterase n=1 Tax=Asticcacaulis solisilvae TaxID=1217274 RepID=UPI003FD7641C
MTDLNLFGWKMGGTTGKSGEAILKDAIDNGRPNLDARQALMAALKAADCLVWSYDMEQRLFEFRGDLKNLGLPALWNRVFIDDLAPVFEAGECERLEAVLKSLDVHTGREAQDHVQCLLRLKDHRLVYFKGARSGKAHIVGTCTDLSRDLYLQRSEGGQGLPLQDINTDPLTGLCNRTGFLLAARALLAKDGDYDLVVADLNRFRRLNEALGHDRADMVLALLAGRLRDAFGEAAVLARLGEDEFAVLTQRGFPRVSERMRGALERSLSVAGFDIHPTFSMGAVSIEGGAGALDSAELLRRAEMAVEAAKSKGAGGVASYKRDLESDGLTRLALEAELRKAFISGEIHAWFQPIINLDTGVITGFEALARWVHPVRGVIPPDHFLGAARDLGLMSDLGTIIMTASVRMLKKWMTAYDLPQGFFISVNLSAPEIERPNLIDDVSRLIRDNGLPNGALKLEVTESDVMHDPVAAARVLDALRDAGAAVALDDFGTGFSSLSYLAKLPFDTLKVDRSFVLTMRDEASSEKIVRAILTLGRDMGLDVVAEGVEDQGLADRLAELGCHMGQGYGFAKPLKAPDAEAFLAASLKQAKAA